METNNRRDFLKKAALAGASALVAPSLFAADGEGRGELSPKIKAGDLESKLIVPKNNGLKITGTFLDEISHDIPHQNWGEKEWDLDFQHMKRIGIDTVIMIRSGYRKFMTYPSPYLLKKGCYMRYGKPPLQPALRPVALALQAVAAVLPGLNLDDCQHAIPS